MEEFVKVCISLRQGDIDRLEQIIKWRNGKIKGDKSSTIRRAINSEYNKLFLALSSVNDAPELEPVLYENDAEPQPLP